MADAQFMLINLVGQGAFIFQFFPRRVTAIDRANWEAQETTIGVKPLFFSNREPRTIQLDELWLDNTDTNESLTPDIKELRALMEETNKGTPPPLLAGWGDRQERCVLQELEISEEFFNTEGQPIRVKVRLSLQQFQPEGESVRVRVIE